MIHINASGAIVGMISIAGAALVAGYLSSGDSVTLGSYFPYALGGWAVGLDFIFRFLGWRTIVARACQPGVLTRDGAVVAPRKRFQEFLEAAFSADAGGQFFWIFPAWILGAGVLAGLLFGGK